MNLLRAMDSDEWPSAKLRRLLQACKEIYNVYGQAHPRDLSADDFLPVFIYCLCSSHLQEPLTTLESLWTLCPQASLQGTTRDNDTCDDMVWLVLILFSAGETGYYLTMLEASLEYIRSTSTHDTHKTFQQER